MPIITLPLLSAASKLFPSCIAHNFFCFVLLCGWLLFFSVSCTYLSVFFFVTIASVINTVFVNLLRVFFMIFLSLLSAIYSVGRVSTTGCAVLCCRINDVDVMQSVLLYVHPSHLTKLKARQVVENFP